MAFWIGLYPKPFFQILEQPVNHTMALARPDYPQTRGERLHANDRTSRSAHQHDVHHKSAGSGRVLENESEGSE